MQRELPKGVVPYTGEPEEVKNPYTGEGITIPADAIAVYDFVKGCDWFRKHEPDAYYVLLD